MSYKYIKITDWAGNCMDDNGVILLPEFSVSADIFQKTGLRNLKVPSCSYQRNNFWEVWRLFFLFSRVSKVCLEELSETRWSII